MSNVGLLTIDEYKTRVNVISKLQEVITGLRESGEPALAEAGEHMFSVLNDMGAALALGLAAYAREADKMRDVKTTGASVAYYVDDLWEALGRYAFQVDATNDVAPLLTQRYALEKLTAAMAEAEAHKAYHDALARGLSDSEARDLAWPPEPAELLVETISEYEREQPPVSAAVYTFPARDLLSGEGPGIAERER